MPGGTRSYEFAKRLVQMGHEVEMITTWREPTKTKGWFSTIESGIKIHWYPVIYSNHLNFFQKIKAFLTFAIMASIKASRIKADIIFASSTPLTICLPAIYASKANKIPIVLEVRDLWPKVPIAMKILKNRFLCYIANLLEVYAYKNSKSIVALSPEMKKGIVSKNVDPRTIAVIPNCSDITNFNYDQGLALKFRKDRPWLYDKPLLLYAGTFGLVNDLFYSIRLARALKKKNSDVQILLIGDGLEKKQLIEEAKKNGVYQTNLHFENEMPKKQIISSFFAANMCANFVIDIEEAWANSANKFFDCLAAGRPIFLNHGGWMQDLINSYNCGLCMHGKSIDLVANELDLAMKNHKWLQLAGDTAKKLALKFFDREELSKQLEKILITTKNDKPELAENIARGIYI